MEVIPLRKISVENVNKNSEETRPKSELNENSNLISEAVNKLAYVPNNGTEPREYPQGDTRHDAWDDVVIPASEHPKPPVGESWIIAADEPDGKVRAPPTPARNTFAAKKTAAQGLMDIALLTANSNQMRYCIEYTRHSSTFIPIVTLITLSLLLQIAVGVALIFKGRFIFRGESKCRRAKQLNDFVLLGVFLITIINVLVASFTTTAPPSG